MGFIEVQNFLRSKSQTTLVPTILGCSMFVYPWQQTTSRLGATALAEWWRWQHSAPSGIDSGAAPAGLVPVRRSGAVKTSVKPPVWSALWCSTSTSSTERRPAWSQVSQCEAGACWARPGLAQTTTGKPLRKTPGHQWQIEQHLSTWNVSFVFEVRLFFFKLCITACSNGLGFVIPNSIAQLFPSSFERLMTWIFCFDLIITLRRSESTHYRSLDCCFTVFVKMTFHVLRIIWIYKWSDLPN